MMRVRRRLYYLFLVQVFTRDLVRQTGLLVERMLLRHLRFVTLISRHVGFASIQTLLRIRMKRTWDDTNKYSVAMYYYMEKLLL